MSGAPRLSRRLRLAVIPRILGMIRQAGPGLMTAQILLMAVRGVLPLAALYLIKLIIDQVMVLVGSPSPDPMELLGLVGIAAGVSLLEALLAAGSRYLGEVQGMVVTDHMHQALHSRASALDLAYFEDHSYFDRLHRAREEAPFRPARIVANLGESLRSLVALAGVAGLLLGFHWLYTLLLALAVIPGAVLRVQGSTGLFRWQRSATSIERRTSYLNWLLTGDTHAKELRILGIGARLQASYRELRAFLRIHRSRLALRSALGDLVIQAAAAAAVFGSFGFVAWRTANGQASLGDLVMFYQAFNRGQTLLRDLLRSLGGLYEDRLFASDFLEFLDLPVRITAPPEPVEVPAALRQGLEARALTFTYPGAGQPALKGVDFTIKSGERVALVGPNGSGKTTLVKLLCRLYDPDQGTLLLDGLPYQAYDPAALRGAMGILFQDFGRYYTSVRDNLLYGAPEGLGDPELLQALAQAGAEGLVDRLPQGLDSILGRWFEGGTELSQGEWQKLALARILLSNRPILILDEPSSSMDPDGEAGLFQRFSELTRGRTTVFISHRLSSVRMADRILVLDQGSLVESGTHSELLASRGLYSRLYGLQAGSWIDTH